MPLLGKAAAGALCLALARVVPPAAALLQQPRPREHFLTDTELQDVDTISCLEAKKQNPAVDCNSTAVENATSEKFSGELSAGNYPSYKDVVCGSNGEYFCDPSGVLSKEERSTITAELQRLRRANPVACPSVQADPVDPTHLAPFYLGVVVAKDWPATQSDPESLHQLGQIIVSQWNPGVAEVGSPIPRQTPCGNTAMLIVMPDKHMAYLSSGSCQIICQGKGGSQVITRTLKSMNSDGAAAGVLAGIEELYTTVSGVKEFGELSRVEVAPSAPERRDPWLNPLLQVFLAIAIVVLVVAVLGGVLVMLLAPGFITARKKMPVV